MMGGATNFMSDTLNDCLSLQRIEDSKMTIVKKRFTMGALIKGATLAVKGNADAKEIVIKVESTLDLYNDPAPSAGRLWQNITKNYHKRYCATRLSPHDSLYPIQPNLTNRNPNPKTILIYPSHALTSNANLHLPCDTYCVVQAVPPFATPPSMLPRLLLRP